MSFSSTTQNNKTAQKVDDDDDDRVFLAYLIHSFKFQLKMPDAQQLLCYTILTGSQPIPEIGDD